MKKILFSLALALCFSGKANAYTDVKIIGIGIGVEISSPVFTGSVTITSTATITGAAGGYGLEVSSNVNLAGGSVLTNNGDMALTGDLNVDGTITGSLTGAASLNVLKTGDTMSGPLTVTSSVTVTGNAFSVGGSTLACAAGRCAVNASPTTYNFQVGGGNTGTYSTKIENSYTAGSGGGLLIQAGASNSNGFPLIVKDYAANIILETYGDGTINAPQGRFSVGGSTLVVTGGKVGILTNAPSVPLQIGAIGIGTPSTGTLLAVGTMAGNNKAIQVIDDGNFGFGEYWRHVYSAGSVGTLGTRHNGVDTDAISWKAGNVGIGTTAPAYKLDIAGSVKSSSGVFVLDGAGSYFNIAVSSTITSANDPGAVGDIRRDADYIYVCTGANTWKRAALTTWP